MNRPKVNPAAGLNQLEQLVNESKQETEVKPVVKKTSPKEKKEVKASNSSEWDSFIKYAQEYKDADDKEKGVQVWLDKDLKKKLDLIKAAGFELPMKHLLSASVRVFLESNSKQVENLLSKI